MTKKTKSFKVEAVATMNSAIGKLREEHRKSGEPMIVWDSKNKKVIEKIIKWKLKVKKM